MNSARSRVLIVGGGFGGLNAAMALKKAPVDVTVIDRRNHHLFQPLLYQVASAALNPSDIAYPIRSALRRQKNAKVILADVKEVRLDDRQVVLDDRSVLEYDFLILAAGATHHYFGNDQWAEFAPGLKSIEDAEEIRRRVLLAYEAAERFVLQDRIKWLTFVVIGGGPTGVEMAGALAEIARFSLARDFRSINPTYAKVILLEGGPRVLPTFTEKLSQKAKMQLEKLGVQVRTSARVTDIDAEGVRLGQETIECKTVIWAAGVGASALSGTSDLTRDRAGRIVVDDDLSLPGYKEVFVIGDMASVGKGDEKVPGVAPAAVQEGRAAARSIVKSIRGLERTPFEYKDKGSLATIGRAAAVAQFGRIKFSGFFAWIAWMLVHILFLIGFRTKVFVMFSWAWSYITFTRGARLITGKPEDILPKSSSGQERDPMA